jgi:hypothetical protein
MSQRGDKGGPPSNQELTHLLCSPSTRSTIRRKMDGFKFQSCLPFGYINYMELKIENSEENVKSVLVTSELSVLFANYDAFLKRNDFSIVHLILVSVCGVSI